MQFQPQYGRGIGYSLEDFLGEATALPEIEAVDVAVAWVASGAVARVADALDHATAQGATTTLITGIDGGMASVQGLQAALMHFQEVIIYHNPAGTFHPKLYMAFSKACALVLATSSNFTLGGMLANTELGLCVRLDRTNEVDEALFIEIARYFRDLKTDKDFARELSSEFLAKLIANPRYPLRDETRPDPGHKPPTGDVLFGATRLVGKATPNRTQPQGGTPPRVLHRWTKRLPKSDAQRLKTSNPSNTVTLVRARHPIDASVYFREEFFKSCNWRSIDSQRERAEVEFEVVIQGRSDGRHKLLVDHNPRFESGQNNRTDSIRWDASLGEYLRKDYDHTNDFLTIEALEDGTFRLVIDRDPTGPFVK